MKNLSIMEKKVSYRVFWKTLRHIKDQNISDLSVHFTAELIEAKIKQSI